MMSETLLVVEDDFASYTLYEQILQPLGVEVMVATDGLAALEALEQSSPRVVVLDILLPEVDGSHVLDYIHTAPHLAETHTCIITAHSQYKPLLHLRPGDVFIVKPATPQTIREVITRMLA